MKIADFKRIITPPIGCKLAGYDLNDVSNSIADDLYMTGLCVDDDKRKVLIISFDLLGLDGLYIQKMRRICADIIQVPEAHVMFTCTHTHSGPETRTMAAYPEQLNKEYLTWLEKEIISAVSSLNQTVFTECTLTYYTMQCQENRNRRYVSAGNDASFTPHWKEMEPIAKQFADRELCLLYFWDKKDDRPLYVIGNYAAHPLAGRTPGLGAERISADYPGAFRDYVSADTGAGCMFISGAAGDMVPEQDEQGRHAVQTMGVNLGKAAISGMIASSRYRKKLGFAEPAAGGMIQSFEVPLRLTYRNKSNKLPPEYLNRDTVSLEVQCICIGDFCFVGVPGELCAELGQEIKWHTPFRKACIAYLATNYFSYMGPANFMVAGGYEAMSQRTTARSGLALVNCAVDTMFALREQLYPSDPEDGEPYPDHRKMELTTRP